MKRTGLARRPQSPVDAMVVQQAWDRQGGRCAVPECRRVAHDPHHRKRRPHGRDDTLDNILLLCRDCHRWVHHNVGEAYERGLLVHSWDDPEKVPVR